MFNFNELEIVHPNEPNRSRGSFVGIRKDKYLNKMAFTLPKGFDNFEKSYDNMKKIFFAMYRTFEKFRQNHETYDDKPTSKDNTQVHNHQGAYIFIDEENNETILYSKIDLIDKIFKTYRELEIESLIQELGLVEDVDYSKIENYLDKGIYLNNNSIFIDHMTGYRNIVCNVPSELIEIFCYIYKELANELEQEISEQLKEIAFNFSYNHLSPEQSLFSEYSFDSTIRILKDCLDYIHKTTAYKNYQYWDIYEAIEHFLYGSLKFDDETKQGFWGINNFSYIWEEMCNYWIMQNLDYKMLYCDTELNITQFRKNLSKSNRIWIDKSEIENIFYIELHSYKRWIRPDVIIKHNKEDEFNGNPLLFALDKGILSIKKSDVPSLLSLGVNRINVDFAFISGQYNFNSNILDVAKKIFDLFANKFANLYKIKGVKHTNLKGYTYNPKTNFFTLKNIPEDIFDKIYKDILNRGNNTKQSNEIFIIDWKYYSHTLFDNPLYRDNDRINQSIIKSLLYEFCLSQITTDLVINQFGIPYYDLENNEIVMSMEKLYSGIQLVRMNFLKIQEIYLND